MAADPLEVDDAWAVADPLCMDEDADGEPDELDAIVEVHSALKPVALVQAGPAVLLEPETKRTGAHWICVSRRAARNF